MVPANYHTFFEACAGIAGTLIGLLFVATSVSPHKDVGVRAPLHFQVQAGVAFTTLLNALVIALLALLPGQNLGVGTLIVTGAGLSSTIGLIAISVHHWPGVKHLWGLTVIPALALLYSLQLSSGLQLLSSPRTPGPVHLEALLVIIMFMIAIGQAWRMIGSRDVRILPVLGDLVRERRVKH